MGDPGDDPDARCARIAAAQHGCVAVWQALDAGLTRRQVARRRSSGRWLPLRPRVDAIAGAPATPHQQLAAAVLTSGREAVASHRSALWLHGLSGRALPAHEVTIPSRSRVAPDGVLVHRTRSLVASDVEVVAGIRATSLLRTVVDMAARLDEASRLTLLDEVVVSGRATVVGLDAAVRRLSRGRPGTASLLSSLQHDDVGRFRSLFERQADGAWAARGLPTPLWNARVRDARGVAWRVDALFAPWPVVAELDSRRWHHSAEAFQRDREMDRGLRARGIDVLRFTWVDVTRSPHRVVDELTTAIGRAMAAGRRLSDL